MHYKRLAHYKRLVLFFLKLSVAHTLFEILILMCVDYGYFLCAEHCGVWWWGWQCFACSTAHGELYSSLVNSRDHKNSQINAFFPLTRLYWPYLVVNKHVHGCDKLINFCILPIFSTYIFICKTNIGTYVSYQIQ